MTRSLGCLSDLELDAVRLATPGSAGAHEPQRHIEGCGGCRDRLSELVGDAAAFEGQFAIAGLAAETLQRASDGPGKAAEKRVWGPLVAVMMSVASVVIVGGVFLPGKATLSSGDRTKGGAAMAVWVQHDGPPRQAVDGDPFSSGDRLMFRMQPGGHDYAMVIGVEESGKVSIYVPMGGNVSRAVPRQGWTSSSKSLQLDDSPGWERVFALYSDRVLSREEVIAAVKRTSNVRSASRLDLEDAPNQASFLLTRASP